MDMTRKAMEFTRYVAGKWKLSAVEEWLKGKLPYRARHWCVVLALGILYASALRLANAFADVGHPNVSSCSTVFPKKCRSGN